MSTLTPHDLKYLAALTRFKRLLGQGPNGLDARETACVYWKASNDGRYGQFWFDGRWVKAHVFVWNLTHGRRAGRWKIRHTCNNSLCVNPRHLRRGTQSQNVRDTLISGRHKRGKKLSAADRQMIRMGWHCGIHITTLAEFHAVNYTTIVRVLTGGGTHGKSRSRRADRGEAHPRRAGRIHQ